MLLLQTATCCSRYWTVYTYAVVADSNLLESVQYKYAVVAVCRVFRISVMSQQSTQYECADQCFDSIIRGPLDPDSESGSRGLKRSKMSNNHNIIFLICDFYYILSFN